MTDARFENDETESKYDDDDKRNRHTKYMMESVIAASLMLPKIGICGMISKVDEGGLGRSAKNHWHAGDGMHSLLWRRVTEGRR